MGKYVADFMTLFSAYRLYEKIRKEEMDSKLETINLDEIQFVGYAFQIEMKFKSWKYGFNVIEVPVIFTDRSEGESKMSGGIFYEAVLGVINMKIRSIFKNWKR